MRVAITGAGGFLGAHLVAELAARGHTTLRVRRDASGDLVAPASSERADALVHLGFPTDASERRADRIGTLRSVARATADAVAIAARLGAAHVVLASTGKVFGRPESMPIADDTPARPTTQLGEVKVMAEHIVACAARTAGFGATSLRIFNAYGEGQPASFLVPTLLEGIARGALVLGELDHARDWIHASDVARAFAHAIEAPATAGTHRTWSVASGEAHSVRSILERLRRAGARVPAPTIDPNRLRGNEAPEERASCESLRALGWSPRISLASGLANLLALRAPPDERTISARAST